VQLPALAGMAVASKPHLRRRPLVLSGRSNTQPAKIEFVFRIAEIDSRKMDSCFEKLKNGSTVADVN
jgi:hypothetical protein